jgi:hypothetical protein
MIAGEPQRPHARVVDREGELADEVEDAVDAAVEIAGEDDLCVGPRAKGVAGAELVSQLEVVEDLAVEHDGDASGRVAHRLRPAHQIDDGEPGVAQRDSVE